jgi:hypothetical protein
MRRVILTLSVLLVLSVSGCATSTDPARPDGTTTSPSTTQSSPPDSQAPSAGEPADTTTTTATVEVPEERPEGPAAPDFTLALGADGATTFVLSQEVKPVFMVFWAEW